jgi:hypothetical protein
MIVVGGGVCFQVCSGVLGSASYNIMDSTVASVTGETENDFLLLSAALLFCWVLE